MSKKTFLCIVLVILLLLPLISCNQVEGTSQESDSEQAAETEAPIMINEDTLIFCRDMATDYSIVIPENATEPNFMAAQQLQSYILQISGVEIPIKKDCEPATELEIAVGYTNRCAEGQFDEQRLGLEGFVIETVGKKLFIAGSGVRGTIYGVYTFLEEYLGCRFYTSEYEKIPSAKTLVVQPIERNEQIPIFEYRDVDFVVTHKNNFHAKLKANGVYNFSEPEYGGKIDYTGGFVHTFKTLVPYEIYGESHPEYFGVKSDGTAPSAAERQLCLSNPDVLAIATESVRKLLENNPNATIISVSQNDSGDADGPCMCENCRKIYEEEGAYSGAIIRFVNAIANTFAQEYPNVKFDTLAYLYSRIPCKTRPADNVIVRICTIECCFSHPLDECTVDMIPDKAWGDSSVVEDIIGWSELTENIYIWDYAFSTLESFTIFPNFNTLLPNVRFFAENNVVGVYEQANFFCETGDFDDLRAYIMSKILWNPYMTEQEYWGHIDDFLCGVYGEGGKYIREYIDLAQQLSKDTHFRIFVRQSEEIFPYSIKTDFSKPLPETLTVDMVIDYENTDWTPYIDYYITVEENPLTARGVELFDAALALATDEQAARIGKIKLQLDYLRSFALYQRAQNVEKNIDKLIGDFIFSSQAGKAIPVSERNSIYRNALNFITEKFAQEYMEYNKRICDEAISYGINRLREQHSFDLVEQYDSLNFSLPPDKWNVQ